MSRGWLLNPLKHGRKAVALRQRSAHARTDGRGGGLLDQCRIRSLRSTTFAKPGGDSDGHGERLANWIWVFRRELRPQGIDTNKAGMCCRISDVDSEAHETHRDC